MSIHVVVLLGPPGAGKGTQARFLCKMFSSPLISMGDLLRNEIQEQSLLGKELQRFVDFGEMSPWSLTQEVLRKKLLSIKQSSHAVTRVIFDGIPRYQSQIADMKDLVQEMSISFDKAILLDVPKDILIQRLLHRGQCNVCNMSSPFTPSMLCANCGLGTLLIRQDDRQEIIARRLELYQESIDPLKHHYKEMNILNIVDGNRPIDKVQRDLKEIVENLNWKPEF